MNQEISDLWNGNLAPCEHCGAQDQTANNLYSRVQRCREEMTAGLTGEQRGILEQYAQVWEDYLLRMMELAFRDGFITGSRLAAEVWSGQ